MPPSRWYGSIRGVVADIVATVAPWPQPRNSDQRNTPVAAEASQVQRRWRGRQQSAVSCQHFNRLVALPLYGVPIHSLVMSPPSCCGRLFIARLPDAHSSMAATGAVPIRQRPPTCSVQRHSVRRADC